jgi:hypothetical protein
MSLFKRNRNTEPVIVPDQNELSDPAAGNLYPAVEGEHLYVTVDRLAALQEAFLDNCKEKGINAQDATAAIEDAITAGAYPGALSLKPKRNRNRDLYFLHGTIPEGVISVTENTLGDLSLGLGKKPDGSNWPTQPNSDEPDAFYIERHHIKHPDEIPTYGDPAVDIPAAQKYKGLNDRLSETIEGHF